MQTADKWLWREVVTGFGTEIKLFVDSIEMKAQTTAADELIKKQHVDGEE